jgi:hypothetical protein
MGLGLAAVGLARLTIGIHNSDPKNLWLGGMATAMGAFVVIMGLLSRKSK